MRNWSSSVALVTGGGHGIGRATALALAGRGARVVICGRGRDALEATAASAAGLPGAVDAVAADVASEDDVCRLFAHIEATYGRLDLLVNNAGVLGPIAPLEEVSLSQWQHTLSVNLTGAFLVAREAGPLLRRGEASLVVNMSSSVGRKGRASWGPYAISKHGVEGLTDVLADEWRTAGTCVVSLNPGGTATRMRAEAVPGEDPATLPTADDVAATIVLLARTLGVAQTGRKYSSRALMPHVDTADDPAALPYDG